MSSLAVADALLIAVRSDVMLGAAVLTVGGAYATGAAMRRRALDPALHWRSAFVSGAHDEAHAASGALGFRRSNNALTSALGSSDESLHFTARHSATLITVAILGLVGALALALSGHPPSPIVAIGPASIAAIAAFFIAVRISRSAATRAILAQRGARLLLSSLFVEMSAATALMVSVAVVVHTAGLTAVSLVEVAAITLATRLAVSLTPWPGGLGVADAILLVPLMWIGVPFHVGLAATIIWRAGSLVAVAAALVVARYTSASPSHSFGPAATDGGRILHRALFVTLGLLPRGPRDALRRRVFDAMFALCEDPWGYRDVPYERRKRDHLLAEVGTDVRTLLEVGCADGHNLEALARLRPEMTIIGTDISSAAVAIAARRTREFGNVRVICDNESGGVAAALTEDIDCLILAEVLYYMGTDRAMRETLQPVRRLMSPDCRVILLHGSADAGMLHERALRALDLCETSSRRVEDPERPFIVTLAHGSR